MSGWRPVSSEGVARREAIRGELVRSVPVYARRRRAVRHCVGGIASAAAVGLLGLAAVTLRPERPGNARQDAAVVIVPGRADEVTDEGVAPEAALAVVVTAAPTRVEFIGDDALNDLLKGAGRESGLVRVGGRTFAASELR